MIFTTPPSDFNPRFHVVSCALEHDGEILLLKRTGDDDEWGTTWCMPGGEIEEGEREIEALLREVREETGLELSPDDATFVAKTYIRHGGFDVVHNFFNVRLEKRFDVRINSEHTEFSWMAPEAALTLELLPDTDGYIKLLYIN